MVVWLLSLGSWRDVFFVFTVPGVVMSFLVWLLIPPQIKSTRHEQEPKNFKATWSHIISLRSAWLIFFGFFTFNIGYWGFLSANFTDIPLDAASHRDKGARLCGVAALCRGFLGLLVFGQLASRWFHLRRPLLVSLGDLGTALFLYGAITATESHTCLIWLAMAAFCMYGSLAPYAGLVAQLAPPNARGQFAGFTNMGGQLGGVLAPVGVGYIVKLTG